MTTSLDLGCGDEPRNHFKAEIAYGVDLKMKWPEVVQADLVVEDIPFPSKTFDYVTAFDFLEHIPRIIYIDGKRRLPFVDLMSEIYRVLKPGGIFFSSTPAYPHPPAFQDPTHVNIITPDTFAEYFDDTKTWARRYGFVGSFHIDGMAWKGPHLQATLRKVSTAP